MKYKPKHARVYTPRHSKSYVRGYKRFVWLNAHFPNRVARQEMKWRDHDLMTGGS